MSIIFLTSTTITQMLLKFIKKDADWNHVWFESFNIFLKISKIISRNYKYKVISVNWIGRKKGVSKFKIKELGAKYLFTLIYCFIEKNLLNIKKWKNYSIYLYNALW